MPRSLPSEEGKQKRRSSLDPGALPSSQHKFDQSLPRQDTTSLSRRKKKGSATVDQADWGSRI